MTPTPPDDEARRLAALRRCRILDTPAERAFDDITLLAARLCDVPIAAVSLIDECRQWFKSIIGLKATETPRDVGFCTHTILQRDVLVVPDARLDARFADNPLVTGDPHLRFYAGTPLVTPEGFALGSLCVIDRVPRTLTPEQQAILRGLACLIIDQLELKRHLADQERLIAEHARMQAELREYAGRFHAAVESMQEGLVLQDDAGVVLVCNPAAERILGLAAAEVVGHTPLDPEWRTIHEDGTEFPGADHPGMRCLRTGAPQQDVVMGIPRPDNTLVWVAVNATPIFHDGAARPHAVVSTFADVTEKKQQEDARARLAAIVASSADAITAMTLDGIIVSWNPGAEWLYGYAAAEIIGNHCSVLAGLGQESPVPDLLQRIRRGEEVPPREVVRRRKDGRQVDVLLTFTPIKDAAGAMIGVAGIGRDITAQKRAEAALQQERRFLGALLENLSEGIVACDADGSLSLFNRASRQFHGLPEEALPPERWAEHFDLFQSDGVTAMSTADIPLFRAFQGEAVHDAEMVIAPKRGPARFLLANGRAIHGAQGEKLGAVIAMHDVTERKRAEEVLAESEARLRHLTDAAFEGIAFSQSGVLVDANRAFLALFNYATLDEVVGKSPGEFAMPESRATVLQKSLEGDEGVYEALCRRQDGSTFHAEVRGRRALWKGSPARVTAIRDITARREAEEALRRAEEKYRGIFENAIDGIFQSDPRGCLYSANPAHARMFGYDTPAQMVAEVTDVGRQHWADPADRARFQALMQAHGQVVGFEAQFRRRNGSMVWVSLNAKVVTAPNDGRLYYEGTAEDITARRAAEDQVHDYAVVLECKMRELEAVNGQLERLATTDGLTGLLNHRAFQERLGQEFRRASRYGTPLSLLLLDVDNFKLYNDTFGHPAGDEVLRTVAQMLTLDARETDVVARYGGEEFVVVLPLTDAAGAARAAERIRTAVAGADWNQRPVTVSIGVCTSSLHTDGPSALVACADRALYRSKAQGRNCVTLGYGGESAPNLPQAVGG